MPDHLAFGLRLRSAEPLPGLPVLAGSDAPDVALHLGRAAPWTDAPRRTRYTSPAEAPGTSPTVMAYDVPSVPALVLDYAEGIRFEVRADGREVWATWQSPLTLDDAMTFLLGPVLGYVLRQRGALALHASAAVFDGTAVAFIGPGGAGKSTLAAACARAGHAVVTDDILVVREDGGRWWTTVAPDQVRLWPDAAASLFGPDAPTTALSPTWPKQGLALDAAGLPRATAPVPLGALLLLAEREPGPAAPRIEPLGGSEVLLQLVGNTYTNYLLDAEARAAELQAVGALASAIPVRRLVPREGTAGLPILLERVAHFVTGRGR